MCFAFDSLELTVILTVILSCRWSPEKVVKRWTLLKSVHIYAKHKVQYETRTHFRTIEVLLSALYLSSWAYLGGFWVQTPRKWIRSCCKMPKISWSSSHRNPEPPKFCMAMSLIFMHRLSKVTILWLVPQNVSELWYCTVMRTNQFEVTCLMIQHLNQGHVIC